MEHSGQGHAESCVVTAGPPGALQRGPCEGLGPDRLPCRVPLTGKQEHYHSRTCYWRRWDREHPRQKTLPLEPPVTPRTGALRAFHVRSHVTAEEAIQGERRAVSQDQAVLDWMRGHPGRHTPPEVLAGLGTAAPLTSIRRALTDLAKAGRLQHWPAIRRQGAYGALNSTWEAR